MLYGLMESLSNNSKGHKFAPSYFYTSSVVHIAHTHQHVNIIYSENCLCWKWLGSYLFDSMHTVHTHTHTPHTFRILVRFGERLLVLLPRYSLLHLIPTQIKEKQIYAWHKANIILISSLSPAQSHTHTHWTGRVRSQTINRYPSTLWMCACCPPAIQNLSLSRRCRCQIR